MFISSSVVASIICLTYVSLSLLKNMCSVLHRPMPSAPKSSAVFASLGVSAFASTPRFRMVSAHSRIVLKSPDMPCLVSFASPSITSPVVPLSVIVSPSWTLMSPAMKTPASSKTDILLHPTMQHLPMPRATTAAWLVMPPLAVRMPCALAMPATSSGEVSDLMSITFSPLSFARIAFLELNTALPVAAPGDAGRPFAIVFVGYLGSMVGNRSCSSWFGSILKTASSFFIMFSFTMSTAIFIADVAVLLPVLVWSMYSFSFSIVNSMSCISR